MTVDEMNRRRKELGYSYARLSELSGVPLSTVQKIFSGATQSPRYETLKALSRVLSQELSEGPRSYAQLLRSSAVLRESVSAYGVPGRKQGEYTIEDYYAIPDEHRTELIDGVIYDMTAPTSFHQLAAAEIYRQIANFILERDGSGMPFIAPVDVQLDQDNRTMLQPDVLIVCHEDRITDGGIYGAPDFVLEVISPSTKRKDYYLKQYKYEAAGVREYWIVDPYQKIILVHFFEASFSPMIYPLDGDVPVNLYGGELVINIARLMKWLPKAEKT